MDHEAQPLALDRTLGRYRDAFLAVRNLAVRTRAEYFTELTDLCRFLIEQRQVTTVQAVCAWTACTLC